MWNPRHRPAPENGELLPLVELLELRMSNPAVDLLSAAQLHRNLQAVSKARGEMSKETLSDLYQTGSELYVLRV